MRSDPITKGTQDRNTGQNLANLSLLDIVLCSDVGAGDNEGPAAAWWEAWEDTQPSERKRKFPTSRPTPDDEKEDASLNDMNVEVGDMTAIVHVLFLAVSLQNGDLALSMKTSPPHPILLCKLEACFIQPEGPILVKMPVCKVYCGRYMNIT